MSNTITSKTSEQRFSVNDDVRLSAANVGVNFGADTVLREVSLTIHAGEFVGLVGQNGSGKTTLLKVLLGLLKPTYGEAKIHNATIGYVPQRGQLYSGIVPISVFEVVNLGSNKNALRALECLKEVGMVGYEKRRFNELSGGQQQRVVIAKALASNADVLILDEPTTGVDESSQVEFYDLLKRLNLEGRTIVMVSHDVDSVVTLVSRIICLDRRVVYDGSPREFISEHRILDGYATEKDNRENHA